MKRKIQAVLMAIFLLAVIHDFNRSCASAGGIPLSAYAGKFVVSAQGSVTYCFTADFSAQESCSTVGAVASEANVVIVSEETVDASGNSCATVTSTVSFPFSTFAPTVTSFNSVTKLTDYLPGKAIGDNSFTDYLGGSCVGATFNNTGATAFETGTTHFVGSKGSNQVNAVLTALTNPLGSIGPFNIAYSAQRQ
ncbi:MAG TPA: hypothetical protein VKT27_11285 [Candidatus Binataceae bacterium]|nr:hypothetical protein [Candidatus Binataceae bacterium]